MSETHVEDPERLRLELNQARVALDQLQTRLADAEAALVARDYAYQDEYWKRYPVDLVSAGDTGS